MSRLVGRDGELAALVGALDGLGRGRASWAQVRGEPGIGKSRLVDELCGMAFDSATGGYYLVASDGGIFAFNAPFFGSMGGKPLNKPVVGMAT